MQGDGRARLGNHGTGTELEKSPGVSCHPPAPCISHTGAKAPGASGCPWGRQWWHALSRRSPFHKDDRWEVICWRRSSSARGFAGCPEHPTEELGSFHNELISNTPHSPPAWAATHSLSPFFHKSRLPAFMLLLPINSLLSYAT